MAVAYEWIVEVVDDESLDIVDTTAWDTAADAVRVIRAAAPPFEGTHYEIALTRNTGDDDVGLQDRQWAYVEPPNHTLPERFDGGAVVPRRFVDELAAATRLLINLPTNGR